MKYIYWPDFKREDLFDLKRDPFEERDLAQDGARARTLAGLRKRFAELTAQAK